jgi:hypothetical protein
VLLFGAWLSIAVVARPALADNSRVVLPSHLSVGNQQFDASLAGIRAYLETTKSSDPQLYAQLAPDLEQLEAKRTNAIAAFAAGVTATVVVGVVGFAGQADCQSPSVTDPNFGAKSAAWGACNDDNMRRLEIFGALGIAAFVAGTVTALAIAPTRADLMDLVNKHNRLSREPLHFELGYDPTRNYAYGGAAVVF